MDTILMMILFLGEGGVGGLGFDVGDVRRKGVRFLEDVLDVGLSWKSGGFGISWTR